MRSLVPVVTVALFLLGCDPVNSNPDSGGGPACPAPTGSGTTHGSSVSSAETWSAADSPHILNNDTSIYAALTLEPCAVVQIAADKTITVNANGNITANGTAEKPVRITNIPGANNWASIRLIGGTAYLTHTTVENGGATLNIIKDYQAAIDVRSGMSAPTAPAPVLFVNHVTIKGSATQGVYLNAGGGITPDSTDLTITGSAGHAATSEPGLAGTFPTGGTYTGNAEDDILLVDTGMRWSVTLKDLGVPYNSGGINQSGVTSVGGITNAVTLTIEPGVKWKFKAGTGLLQLDPGGNPSRAILVAKGTAARPIVFTSAAASPAAGDWLGIWMGGDGAANALDHVRIEYAGKLQGGSGSNSCQSLQAGTTRNGGALRVYNLPPAGLVTNSEFVSSATNAIDRGWRDDQKPSFLSGNTFTGIAQCKETHPRDTNGACPTTPPCP